MIHKAKIGYYALQRERIPFGWAVSGPWAHCVMDDFGTLVFTGGASGRHH